MNLLWSTAMGTVQGLTEFFPVSSSGHLTVIPYIFSFTDPGLSFNIALHAGTLVAIVWVFRNEWKKLARGVAKKEKDQIKLLKMLALTTVPGALAGLFFEEMAETIFRNPGLVALNLTAFGLVLYFIDKKIPQKIEISRASYRHALAIGLSQAVAIIPGVSRSGATITAARALGFKRDEALRYSFLSAAPIILGATVFGLRDININDLLSIGWLLGFIAAVISSAWAMLFLLKYVQGHDFKIFLWWRVALAVVILLLMLSRG